MVIDFKTSSSQQRAAKFFSPNKNGKGGARTHIVQKHAEIVEDGNGAKPALTVLPFRSLTRGGCILRR
jgi:hypothetical protein